MAKAKVCVYGTYFDNLDSDISELSTASNIFGNSSWIVAVMFISTISKDL
jgi:hypothetical protein